MNDIFKKEEFLKELSKLSKKYNIYIDGCGCCGSPFLEYMGDDNMLHIFSNNITFDHKSKEYKENNN